MSLLSPDLLQKLPEKDQQVLIDFELKRLDRRRKLLDRAKRRGGDWRIWTVLVAMATLMIGYFPIFHAGRPWPLLAFVGFMTIAQQFYISSLYGRVNALVELLEEETKPATAPRDPNPLEAL